MESRVCDVSVEVVSVKEEPDWEQSEEYEQSAEDAALAPAIFAGPEEKPVRVKEEPTSDDAGSGTEGAVLYADHKVKDELVLGSEEVQTPGGAGSAELVSVKEEPPASESAGSCSESAEPPDLVQEIRLTPVLMVQPAMVYVVNGSTPPVKPVKPESAPKAFQCHLCEKSFKWARHLKRHIQLHYRKLGLIPPSDKTKPFYCVTCKKEFSQLLKFTVHLQQHTSEIPYSCGICKKEFARHSGLVKHNQTHLDMPHGCEVCKERFVHKVELIRHKLSHTCVNPMCGVCDKHSRIFNQSTHKRINILRR